MTYERDKIKIIKLTTLLFNIILSKLILIILLVIIISYLFLLN